METVTSDLDRQIEQLKRCETITESEVKSLCTKAREILVEESNVQRVDSPVTVIINIIIGPIHDIYNVFRNKCLKTYVIISIISGFTIMKV